MRNLLGILATCLLAGAPLAQECPDEKATNVDARIDPQGHKSTCGFGFVLFGIGGGILGEDCYRQEFLYPAHQECQGEQLAFHYCETEGNVEVRLRECHCGGAVIPFLQIGVPTDCECGDWVNAGQIEDAQTRYCTVSS